jgi:NTE family protein
MTRMSSTAGRAPPKVNARRKLPYETVALVLQGGGALGAYQAGVYEGLAEAGIEPDWVAGISIGALNCAIIAGNPPSMRVEKLRGFWETICRPAFFQPTTEIFQTIVEQMGGAMRKNFNAFEAWRAIVEGQKGFFVPRFPPTFGTNSADPADASFYDTAPLKATLETFADFDLINAEKVRVSIGAVNVRNGNFKYFDNIGQGRLRPEHFMASGALPPAFPPVKIGDEFYWDGGLVSNTPLEQVMAADPRRDTLAFQVDLWSARGLPPQNVFDAQERMKDIQYSSRTRMVTDQLGKEQHFRRLLRELLEHVPPAARDDPWVKKAMVEACPRRYNIIHLIYRDKEYEGLSKDYEFSPLTMREHWAAGLADIRRSLSHPHWLELPPEGREFITHDVHRSGK